MSSFFNQMMPYILLVIILMLFVVGVILLSYLLIFGAAVGFTLCVFAWIKQLFQKKRGDVVTNITKKSGQTIDHDDL